MRVWTKAGVAVERSQRDAVERHGAGVGLCAARVFLEFHQHRRAAHFAKAAVRARRPVDRARLAATIRQHVYGSGVVLIVDDEPESRQIARRHLDRLGWEFAEAEDGESALLWLSQNPRPAMILLDLLMPGMNGFTFLDETAKRVEWQDIPIVIMTAMPLDAAERALLAGRTREVIAKGADDLAQALRQVLVRLPKVTELAPTA